MGQVRERGLDATTAESTSTRSPDEGETKVSAKVVSARLHCVDEIMSVHTHETREVPHLDDEKLQAVPMTHLRMDGLTCTTHLPTGVFNDVVKPWESFAGRESSAPRNNGEPTDPWDTAGSPADDHYRGLTPPISPSQVRREAYRGNRGK